MWFWIGVAFVAWTGWKLFGSHVRRAPKRKEPGTDFSYNMGTIHAPKLSGIKLKLFGLLLEVPILGALIVKKIKRDSNFHVLRKINLEAFAGTVQPTAMSVVPPHTWPGSDAEPDEALQRVEWPPLPTEGFQFPTMSDYAEAYRIGKTTPVAIAERFVALVKESNGGMSPPLNAVIRVNEEHLMRQARASQARLEAGTALSEWDGVPIVIKDELDVKGYPTYCGTSFLGDSGPVEHNATLVDRLLDAGFLVVGKANMFEIGVSPNGWNVHHGFVANPYEPRHDPGGSSSGSAAAVAAGLVPCSIGADGGGSIRVPASLCGVVGLKPTFNRVSEHGAFPLCFSVGHVGPIATCVQDVYHVYRVIAGRDPADPFTHHQPLHLPRLGCTTSLEGCVFGVYEEWVSHSDPGVRANFGAQLDVLRAAGATVKSIVIPDLEEQRVAHVISIVSEMASTMNAHTRHKKHTYAPTVRLALHVANTFTATDYVLSQKMRTYAIGIYRKLFEDEGVHAIITPTTASVAPAYPSDISQGLSDLAAVSDLTRYVFPGNLIGLPAISVPSGYDASKHNLPFATQIMATQPFDENVCVRAALMIQQSMQKRKPLIWLPTLQA